MRSVLGIILGGGEGKRLYPLTKFRSKPAVPIAGKYRLIDIPVSNCIHSGIQRIFILTQFNSASLNRHINLTYKFDAFHEGFVDILAAEQTMDSVDWFQGTADAVRKTFRHFQRFHPSDYLILAGDHIYQMDYRRMLQTHQNSDADITVAVAPVTEAEAGDLGILAVWKDGLVSDFIEKPKTRAAIADFLIKNELRDKFNIQNAENTLLGSMGVYLFKHEALKSALMDYEQTDFGKHIIPDAIGKKKVQAHIFGDYWRDIGTISAFCQANLNLCSPEPKFHFYSEPYRIFTHARYLPGSKILSVKAESSIICEGCVIEDAVLKNSLIGLRTVIRKGAQVENTYIMGADFYVQDPEIHAEKGIAEIGIGEGAQIYGAIVDKNACIGRGVKITPKNPGENYAGRGYMIRDGITVIEKDAVIPDGMVI